MGDGGPPFVVAREGHLVDPPTPADPERLRDRPEGTVPLQLLGRPGEATETEAPGLAESLLEEERLADAGLAFERDKAPFTLRSPGERQEQPGKLRTAADERRFRVL